MRECVILNKSEWDKIPKWLAEILEENARGEGGFRIISKETGEEIDDKLKEWLCGQIYLAMNKIEGGIKTNAP